MHRLSRRDLLCSTLAVGASWKAARAAASPNETVQVAVVGTGRGTALANWFTRVPDSHVVLVCDVNETRGNRLCEELESLTGKRPPLVVDFRKVLERKDVDALAVATPNHWHAPITIAACMAGKDVYVEKPCCHNPLEGRTAVKAARKYQRIVQHGTQLRAVPYYQEAWGLLREGVIGKVLMVKAINNQRRRRYPHTKEEAVPPGLHYDMWLGPAHARPFNRDTVLRDRWIFEWDFGLGDIGNDGVHQIDIGRWALGLKAPQAVSCSAAKLGSRGDAQHTPDAMVVTWEYEDLLYVYEQRDFTPFRLRGHREDNDNIFYGDKGFMMIDRNGYRVFFKNERGPSAGKRWSDSTAHYQNFIDCVKSRKYEDLNADIEEAHYSTLLCHLANIAYRTGRRLHFDPKTETFPGDEQANQYLSREYRKGFELPRL